MTLRGKESNQLATNQSQAKQNNQPPLPQRDDHSAAIQPQWHVVVDVWNGMLTCSLEFTASRKHAYIILTPLNPTFI